MFAFSLSPRRQFRVLVAIGCIAFAGVVVFHLYFLSRIQAQDVFAVVPDTSMDQGQTVNAQKLASVLDRYQAKADVRAKAVSALPLVSEPSR